MRLFRIIFALSMMMALSSCSYVSSDWLYYKIILEVEADGKIYSGYSVNGQRFVGPKFWGATTNFVSGAMPREAAYVDIGEHGTLFALLPIVSRSGDFSVSTINNIPKNRFLKSGDRGLREENVEKLNALKGQSKELSCLTDTPPDEYTTLDCPLMVRFGDINDPASVQKIDPKNLAASFGEGVKLRSVRVEITDGPYSRKIDEKLPWLKHTNNNFQEFTEEIKKIGIAEASQRGLITLAMTVHRGHFRMGYKNDK